MSDDFTDIVGVPIEVGDTVVYGVKSEYSTLQVGVVEELIPYKNRRSVPNPYFNPNLPRGDYDYKTQRYANDPSMYEDFIDYKIKVRGPDEEWYDIDNVLRKQKGSTKTLPGPKRFAVVKKGS